MQTEKNCLTVTNTSSPFWNLTHVFFNVFLIVLVSNMEFPLVMILFGSSKVWAGWHKLPINCWSLLFLLVSPGQHFNSLKRFWKLKSVVIKYASWNGQLAFKIWHKRTKTWHSYNQRQIYKFSWKQLREEPLWLSGRDYLTPGLGSFLAEKKATYNHIKIAQTCHFHSFLHLINGSDKWVW